MGRHLLFALFTDLPFWDNHSAFEIRDSFYTLLSKSVPVEWHQLIDVIGNRAMADVFAISVFNAFLGTRAMRNFTASLEPGFYYFTAYILLSTVIVGLLNESCKI